MSTTGEEVLSAQEAAERLGVSVWTVWRWIKEGKLKAYKPGKEYRVRAADLEEFFAAREVRPKVVTGEAHLTASGTLHARGEIKIDPAKLGGVLWRVYQREIDPDQALAELSQG